jgi:hypothetical protein
MQRTNAERSEEEVAMALSFTQVFAIQAAIDAYENKFPNRPSPSPEEALAWQAGGRGRKPPGGVVLHDTIRDVLLLRTDGRDVTAKIQLRVVRAGKSGLLDFYYRIFTGASPLSGPTDLGFRWAPPAAGIEVTFADHRSDGIATTAPDDFICRPPCNRYSFTFSKGVPAHTSTDFFFVSTNARAFSASGGELGDAYLPGTTTILKVPGPVAGRGTALSVLLPTKGSGNGAISE